MPGFPRCTRRNSRPQMLCVRRGSKHGKLPPEPPQQIEGSDLFLAKRSVSLSRTLVASQGEQLRECWLRVTQHVRVLLPTPPTSQNAHMNSSPLYLPDTSGPDAPSL